MGQLKQLNFSFHAMEDRLLFRIRTDEDGAATEYRFWMTRRFVRLIWKALEEILEAEATVNPLVPPDGRDAFIKFQQEAALTNADFQTPYSNEEAQSRFGPAPLLLHGFRITKGSNGTFALLLQTATDQSITLNLNETLVISVRKLIAEEVRRAEWDVPLTPSPPVTAFKMEASRTIN